MTAGLTQHGVFLAVSGSGVLLRGPSGIGKSALALELIDRGHQLVADDSPEFRLNDKGQVIGYCPGLLQDFLHVRGLGILNIRRLFGDQAISKQQLLALIIHLNVVEGATTATVYDDSLSGNRRIVQLLDRQLPELTLYVDKGTKLSPLWVECAVAEQQLRAAGYCAASDISKRLRAKLTKQAHCLVRPAICE